MAATVETPAASRVLQAGGTEAFRVPPDTAVARQYRGAGMMSLKEDGRRSSTRICCPRNYPG
jgi:hypothetical protein